MNTAAALCMVISSFNLSGEAKGVACEYMPYIIEESNKANLEVETILAIIYVESRFKVKAKSRSNACGLMQLIPKWNKEVVEGKKIRYSCEQIMEPKRNIRLGIKAIKRWLKVTRGNMDRALCGYNAGVACIKKIKYPAKFRYVKSVRKIKKKIKDRRSKLALIKQSR